MGSTSKTIRRNGSVSTNHTLTDLSRQMQRLWEQNEVYTASIPSPDDVLCEELFTRTHTRASNGRYTVRLPMRPNYQLGESRASVLQLLLSLERRLVKNEELHAKYVFFLEDYLRQGHMRIASNPVRQSSTYYLPHHPVLRQVEGGTKIRVVFNASAKTSNGYSLNDHMLTGPKLQKELWLILSRWRFFQFVFTVDAVQMFRQINIHVNDQDFQRILWRSDPTAPVQEFCLTTVTYGMAAAPYLAIRTCHQLADDEEKNYQCAATALRKHSYVDDIFYVGHALQQALQRRQQLIDLLALGGFSLSKWAANHPDLCPDQTVTELLFADKTGVSTLGVLWSVKEDTFQLRAVPACNTNKCSKRMVLSNISRFFEPLGWATPVLIFGRIFLQKLWTQKLSWDAALPDELHNQWVEFASTLHELSAISIPRFIHFSPENCQLSLHGFSDASDKAFAAVLYLRCVVDNTTFSHLLVAKSKVAPLFATSIPRLELCGAALLAKVMKASAAGLDLTSILWHLWTDAQVVLRWLQGHPSQWQPYVAHRIAAIQEVVPYERWRHVPTESNPADLFTRGIKPSELKSSSLWWHRPSWLSLPPKDWPKSDHSSDESIDVEVESAARRVCVVNVQTIQNDLLTRYSHLNKLVRVVAWILRFEIAH